jgi:uncharacterized membrane protein YkvI
LRQEGKARLARDHRPLRAPTLAPRSYAEGLILVFVLCSILTVTCVWPAAVLFAALLFAIYPPLGWLFLVLVTVPIWARWIDAAQRRFEVA